MELSEHVIPAVMFVAVSATIYSIFELLDPYSRKVRSRIDDLQAQGQIVSIACEGGERSSSTTLGRLAQRIQVFGGNNLTERSPLQQRLERAGFYRPSSVAKYLAVRLLLAAAGSSIGLGAGALGFMLKEWAVLLACVLGVLGALTPRVWLDHRIARRQSRLNKSLPDFLDVLTVCLDGGLSFQESIRRVSDELHLVHPTLVSELRLVQRDIELGGTVDQALKRFANRANNEAVRTMSTFVREAQRLGTNIADALRSHADMLRSQREQAAEEKAQAAAVKILLPTFLLIFPAIFVVAVGPAIIQIHEAFANQ